MLLAIKEMELPCPRAICLILPHAGNKPLAERRQLFSCPPLWEICGWGTFGLIRQTSSYILTCIEWHVGLSLGKFGCHARSSSSSSEEIINVSWSHSIGGKKGHNLTITSLTLVYCSISECHLLFFLP